MVRRSVVVACALLMAFTVPVSAQTSDEGDFILEDSAGDANGAAYAPVDLVSLSIQETEEQLIFRIGMDDMESREDGGGTGTITLDFVLGHIEVSYESGQDEEVTQYRDQYRLQVKHDSLSGNIRTDLYVFDVARGEYVPSYAGCDTDCRLTAEIDETSGIWVIPVPRGRLQTADAVTPSPAVPLHRFMVTAVSSAGDTGTPVSVTSVNDPSGSFGSSADVMPDDGEPAGQFIPLLGVPPQVGPVRLTSDTPFRWSNGEATTYVFDVTLNKSDAAAYEITLSTSGVPESWDVSLPGESIYLEGPRRLQLPVVLTTPFSHEHGAFETFHVEARSENDPDAIGRVELGIRYSGIPQPTGHHSRMWLHAGEPEPRTVLEPEHNVDGQERTNGKFMSALDPAQQPGSTDAWIYPNGQTAFDPADADFTWIFPLEPPLRTGFDFDMQRDGEVTFEFESAVPLEDVVIFGGLYYRTPGTVARGTSPYDHSNDKLLAAFYSSDSQDMEADQPTAFSALVRSMPDGDYIPFKPQGAYVFLSVTLRYDMNLEQQVDWEMYGPWMHPGAAIDFPLNEYHDNVGELFIPLNDVTLELSGPQRQYVNPGESVYYELLVNNSGIANERFNLRVRSLNAEWVTILAESPLEVPSNGQATLGVVVTAPLDAWHGQIAGPLVEVISLNNPWSQASQRLYVEVDHENDHPDMSHLLGPDARPEQQEASWAFVPGLLAMAAALVMRRRTRRI